MAKNDGRFETEEEEDSSPKGFSLLVIDQLTVPVKYCANGHIVEWRNEENGISLAYMRIVNTDEGTLKTICPVCGQPGVEEPQDAQSTEG